MAKALNVSVDVTANTGQAKAALQDLQASLSQLSSNATNLNIGLNANQIQEASRAVTELQAHLRAATNTNTGNLSFAKLDASLRASKTTLSDYGAQLLQLGPQGQQAFQKLTQSVALSEVPVRRLSGVLGEFGTVVKNTIRWQASSSLIHGFVGSIQSAFNYAQDLNKSLTNIQIVTGHSSEQMAEFAENANKAAKNLSTTTTRYTNASLIYYQQGLSDKEVAARTETTIKMANVSGQTAEKVSDQMTAIWNNFAKGSDNLEYYADVITALGAATASSSAEIATGLSKFASIADTVGLSYENATAALATITATTRQSADTVGTGLRTIFSRLSSLSLGETLEDGVNLTKYSKALDTVGVKVLDASGQLRSMDAILDDLGEQWGNLTNAQQTALAQTVGGVRQYTTIMALMENYDFYKENLDIAKMSEGTVQKQQEIYEKSWEASSKRVRASAESIYSSLINDDFFIGLNNTISGILDLINNVITSLGGLRGVLFGIGAIATTVFRDNFAKGLYNAKNTIKELITPTYVWESKRQDALTDLIQIAASPNTSQNVTEQQQTFLKSQLQSQLWMAKNKDNLSPFDLYNQQLMQDAIQRQINDYNAAIQKQSDIKDQKSDIRSGIFGEARANYQRQQRAAQEQQYFATAARNNGGNIRTERLNNADRQRFDTALQEGLINRAGQALGRQSLKNISTEADFIKEFGEDFGNNITKAIQNSKAIATLPQNLMQDLAESSKMNTSESQTISQSLIEGIGLSQEQIDGITKGLNMQEIADMGLNTTIDQLAAKYGVATQSIYEYIEAIQKEAEADGDVEAAEQRVRTSLEARAKAQEQAKQQMQREKNITSAISGITSLGMAISQVNGIINQFNNVLTTGEGAGQAFLSMLITLPMAFTGILSAVKAIEPMITGFAGLFMATNPLGTAAIIMAAVAALTIGVKALDKAIETPSEKIKRITEETEKMQTWANSAKTAYDNLMSSESSHEGLVTQLETLTKGTKEFYNTLTEANHAAKDLISDYDLQFGEDADWYYGKDNRIQFTEQGKKNMEDQAKAQSNAADYIGDLAEQYKNGISKSRFDIYRELLGEEDYKKFQEQTQSNAFAGPTDQQFNNIVQKHGFNDVNDFYARVNQMYQDYAAIDFSTAFSGYASQNDIDLSSLAASAALSYLGANTSTEEFKTQFEQALSEVGSSGNLSQEFFEAMGFKATGELAKDTVTMKNMIAAQRLMTSAGGYQDQFNTNLENAQKFASATGIDKYQELDYNSLTALVNTLTSAELAFNGLQQIMVDRVVNDYNQMNRSAAEAILKAQGVSDEEIKETTQETANQITQNLFANNIDLTKEGLNGALQTVNTIRSSFQKDSTIANTFWDAIFGKDNSQFDSRLNGVLSNINFGNQVQAAFDLRRYAQLAAKDPGLSKALSDLSDTYIEELGGKSGLLEKVWETEDFQNSLKSLQKQFKQTGKIGAQNILDIADSCEILSDALEFGEISAGALADIIETMGLNGTLSISDLSNALLEALGLANSLEDTWANSFKFFTDFDSGLGPDMQSIADSFNKYSKDMFDLLGEGNVGGDRLYQEAALVGNQYYANNMRKFIYDQEKINADNPWARQAAYQEQYGEWDEVLSQTQKEGNMNAYWNYMLNNDNATKLFGYSQNIAGVNAEGNPIYKTIAESLQDLGFSNAGENGDIELDVGNQTTQQLTEGLSKALNISLEEAAARLTEFTSHSQSAYWDLQKNDFRAAAASFGENTIAGQATLNAWRSRGVNAQPGNFVETEASMAGFNSLSVGEQATFLDANQEIIKTLAEEGDAYGKLYQAQANKINQQRESIQITRDQSAIEKNSNEVSAEVIKKARDYVAANQDLSASIKTVTNDKTGETQSYMDAGMAIANYTAQGLTAEESLVAATEDATESGAKLGGTYTDAFGQIQVEAMQAGETAEEFQARLAQLGDDAATQRMGQNLFIGFTQAMSNLEVNSITIPPVEMTITSNIGEIQEAINEISQVDSIGISITDNGTAASIQTLIDAVQGHSVLIDVSDGGQIAQIQSAIDSIPSSKTVTINVVQNGKLPGPNAAGGFVAYSHASGSNGRNLHPGLSLTAEEGPEVVWNKNEGYAYLVGGEGHPEFAMLRPGDRVFNANQTREILNYDRPDSNYFNSILKPENMNQKMFGSFAEGSAYGSYGPNSRFGGRGGGANAKEQNYTPERYHVITRQIQDLTFWYEELKKARENAYGTEILNAIDKEIEGVQALTKAQEALVKEAEDYQKLLKILELLYNQMKLVILEILKLIKINMVKLLLAEKMSKLKGLWTPLSNTKKLQINGKKNIVNLLIYVMNLWSQLLKKLL